VFFYTPFCGFWRHIRRRTTNRYCGAAPFSTYRVHLLILVFYCVGSGCHYRTVYLDCAHWRTDGRAGSLLGAGDNTVTTRLTHHPPTTPRGRGRGQITRRRVCGSWRYGVAPAGRGGATSRIRHSWQSTLSTISYQQPGTRLFSALPHTTRTPPRCLCVVSPWYGTRRSLTALGSSHNRSNVEHALTRANAVQTHPSHRSGLGGPETCLLTRRGCAAFHDVAISPLASSAVPFHYRRTPLSWLDCGVFITCWPSLSHRYRPAHKCRL